MSEARQIKVNVSVFEDVLPKDFVEGYELGRAWVTPAMVDWWQQVMSELEKTTALTQPKLNPYLVHEDTPDEITIEFMLCSRNSLEEVTGTTRALGCHLVSTMDGDPFNEETNLATKYRVLMVSDREEFLGRMADLADDHIIQGSCDRLFLQSWLNTAFHEIAHAVLFAENAGFMSPHEIESLSDAGNIDNDVFDCATGYGIRPLDIQGDERWSDDVESAREDMEVYVEALGSHLQDQVQVGDLHPMSFLKAAEIEDEFHHLMQGGEPDGGDDTPEPQP
jgi:hypothetical protein